MSVEYQTAKEAARKKLISFCVSNLTNFNESSLQAKFTFEDYWGEIIQAELTHAQNPILNFLSRTLVGSFRRSAWVN